MGLVMKWGSLNWVRVGHALGGPGVEVEPGVGGERVVVWASKWSGAIQPSLKQVADHLSR